METIGQHLRRLRGDKTQKELSDILELTGNYYGQIELDQRKISRKVAKKLVKLYGETEEYWRV